MLGTGFSTLEAEEAALAGMFSRSEAEAAEAALP